MGGGVSGGHRGVGGSARRSSAAGCPKDQMPLGGSRAEGARGSVGSLMSAASGGGAGGGPGPTFVRSGSGASSTMGFLSPAFGSQGGREGAAAGLLPGSEALGRGWGTLNIASGDANQYQPADSPPPFGSASSGAKFMSIVQEAKAQQYALQQQQQQQQQVNLPLSSAPVSGGGPYRMPASGAGGAFGGASFHPAGGGAAAPRAGYHRLSSSSGRRMPQLMVDAEAAVAAAATRGSGVGGARWSVGGQLPFPAASASKVVASMDQV